MRILSDQATHVEESLWKFLSAGVFVQNGVVNYDGRLKAHSVAKNFTQKYVIGAHFGETFAPSLEKAPLIHFYTISLSQEKQDLSVFQTPIQNVLEILKKSLLINFMLMKDI